MAGHFQAANQGLLRISTANIPLAVLFTIIIQKNFKCYKQQKSRSDDRKLYHLRDLILNNVTILPNHYLSAGIRNNGCTVYHAINGKNIMGTARPGNNSGN